MFILTSNRAEAKEKNNEQSFSAREMGKNVKRLTICSVGKGTGAPLAGIQIGTAFLEDILATANIISKAQIPPVEIPLFLYLSKRTFHTCV